MSRDDSKNREVDLDHLERHLENECKKRGITRRELMKGGMAMATALGIGALFAACGGDDDAAAPAPAPAPGALSFSDPGWTTHVAADEAFDWPRPAVAFDADGLPVIFHQGPTGQLGPEGETKSGLAVTT